VPILCTGERTPFVTPRAQPPNMSLGVHWNIQQNLWNTNVSSQRRAMHALPSLCHCCHCLDALLLCVCVSCGGVHSRCACATLAAQYVLWYPFEPEDKHTLSRFQMKFD
jgi:hypothetical protein